MINAAAPTYDSLPNFITGWPLRGCTNFLKTLNKIAQYVIFIFQACFCAYCAVKCIELFAFGFVASIIAPKTIFKIIGNWERFWNKQNVFVKGGLIAMGYYANSLATPLILIAAGAFTTRYFAKKIEERVRGGEGENRNEIDEWEINVLTHHERRLVPQQ